MRVSIANRLKLEPSRVADFVATQQANVVSRCAYASDDAAALATEIAGVDSWESRCAVAIDGDDIVGCLLAEVDDDVGRAWWWGPFATADRWADVADRLYAVARALLPEDIEQEEAAGPVQNIALAEFCARHDFEACPASVALAWESPVGRWHDGVTQYDQTRFGDELAALHDAAFGAAHRTGAQLRDRASEDDVIVTARVDDRFAGYAVGQVQADGHGYIDFVAVAPERRRTGVAHKLIAGLTSALVERGVVGLHLSVRQDNPAARALYAKLGFQETAVMRPYRKGFALV